MDRKTNREEERVCCALHQLHAESFRIGWHGAGLLSWDFANYTTELL